MVRFVFYLFIFLSCSLPSFGQPYELVKIGQWESPAIPPQVTQKYNDVKFWKHPDGKSYALLGGANEIYIIDISQPASPRLITALPGKSQNCINRDLEVNDSLLFAVADEGSASLQIYNLRYLPDSAMKIYDSDSLCRNAHNISLSQNYIYLCKNFRAGKLYAMEILDISNPVKPILAGTLSAPTPGGVPLFPYVHDVCIAGDTAFCSCANGGLYIYNISDKKKPALISSLTSYPLAGYNHSSAWYGSAKTLYFTDENKGSGMKVADLKNIKFPDIPFVVQPAPGVTPHNPSLSGSTVLLATYQDGVNIYSLKNPFQPEKWYYYDTYPQNAPGDYSGLIGCWTVVAGEKPDTYIASDTHNGLFILASPFSLGSAESTENPEQPMIYPNPTDGTIHLRSVPSGELILLFNVQGQNVASFYNASSIDFSGYASGIYFLRIGNCTKKIVLKPH